MKDVRQPEKAKKTKMKTYRGRPTAWNLEEAGRTQ